MKLELNNNQKATIVQWPRLTAIDLKFLYTKKQFKSNNLFQGTYKIKNFRIRFYDLGLQNLPMGDTVFKAYLIEKARKLDLITFSLQFQLIN